MSSYLKQILLSVSFILAFCLTVHAAFILKNIDLPAQFEGSVIRMAAYDEAGMIWFVTNGGLFRYDGNEAVAFNLQTRPSVNYAAINCMLADTTGNLWLGDKNGLVKFDLKSWTTKQIPFSKPGTSPDADRTITHIFLTTTGQLLAISQDGKVFELSHEKLKKIFDVRTFFHDHYYKLTITSIIQSKDGTLWLSTSAGFLVNLDLSGKTKPATYGLPELNDRRIGPMLYIPQKDLVLFAWDNQVYTMNCQTKKIYVTMKLPVSSNISFCNLEGKPFMLSDRLDAHGPWISLINLSAKELTDSISTLKRWPKFESSRGNKILMSNSLGLFELTWENNRIQTLLNPNQPEQNNSIRTLFKVEPNELLISSYKDQFIRLNLETGKTNTIDQLHPYTFLRWNADSILMGEEGRVLFWYESKSKRVTYIPLRPRRTAKDSIRDHYITCLYRQTDSTVWVGSFQGLFLVNIYRRYTQNLLQGPLASTVQQSKVFDIVPLREKWIIATTAGLFYFNEKDYLVKTFSDSLGKQPLFDLQIMDHKLWVGSDGLGLIEMDSSGHILKVLNRTNGLAGNTLFSLKRWHQYLVAGTEHGVSIIHLPDIKSKNFTTYDGLPSNECNHSALLVADSEAYVGTTNGLAIFNIGQLFNSKRDSVTDAVVISELEVENSNGAGRVNYSLPYKRFHKITIPAGTSFFSFTINNMNNMSPYQQVFYRVSPHEPWHEVTDKRKFSFVNMAPGTYYLELTGKMYDGQWGNTIFATTLFIVPLYYQTVWFKILLGLITLAFIIFIVSFIIRYREKQAEKERMLRLQIAGDLHDEVGSMLTGMSLQADFLLQERGNKSKEYLKSIADTGRSAIHIMGDIVWSIDPQNDDTISLIRRLKKYGQQTFEHVGIKFTFDSDGDKEQKYLSQKIRQNIMLIFKEALTNICKHAEATQVEASVTITDYRMKLIIADNGKGLSGDKTGGHGLRNMQMRADAIHATLRFPETEKGATIVLELKV